MKPREFSLHREKSRREVQQMTGLADPVYVEAFLQVHSFDLMLELLVVNRTNETLQNVLVELSTQVTCAALALAGKGGGESYGHRLCFVFSPVGGRCEGLRSKVSQVELMIDLGRDVIDSRKSNPKTMSHVRYQWK